MKKFLSIIFVMMMLAFNAIADDSTASSKNIKLEITQYNTPQTPIHRAPAFVNIGVYYNAESNSIDIYYDGEAEGEVYLYLDGNIVGYDSAINTSLQLPAYSGLYKIEIISESWIAEGYLQL